MNNKNITELKKLFFRIKNVPLTKSLRKGTTGLGYTFESLIGKDEDSSYLPDFKGIEIKTKLGYTKTPITLFCLTPIKNNTSAIKFIYNNFGYPNKHNHEYKSFKGNVYYNRNNLIANKYILKTKLELDCNKLCLLILDNRLNFIDKSIYWDLNEIKNRLSTKLNYLAIIKGYPYNKDKSTFYKYTSLKIYKLKSFDAFLNLLKKDKIYITFNLDTYFNEKRFGDINDRGTAFKLELYNIDDLFDNID